MRDLKSEIAKYLTQPTTAAAKNAAEEEQGEEAKGEVREGAGWKVVTMIERRAELREHHATGSTRPRPTRAASPTVGDNFGALWATAKRATF